MNKILLITVFVCVQNCLCMEPITVIAVPGQNGTGSEPDYVRRVLGTRVGEIIPVGRAYDMWHSDLGQVHCGSRIRKVLKQGVGQNGVIMYGTSEGASSILNVTKSLLVKSGVKACVVESPFASGNSAIYQVTDKRLGLACLTRLPGARYWLPYVVKAGFPSYWPWGAQPIKSIEHFPDIPVIFVRSQGDRTVSCDDSAALYARIRARGNKRAYLVTLTGADHVRLIKEGHEPVLSILQKEGVVAGAPVLSDLQAYQPDSAVFARQWQELRAQERVHTRIGVGLLVGAALLACRLSKKLATV